ncbi:MAG: hypothetical protein KBS55_00355 [Bacteroidales bacterium]|nr:hypothetical protein [Candidatus Cryptobacteroides aphodequi]
MGTSVTVVHEFGHMIGLKDRYETVTTAEHTYSMPQEGFEGTVMAEGSGLGVVTPEDISAVLCVPDVHKPGVYYIDKYNAQKN